MKNTKLIFFFYVLAFSLLRVDGQNDPRSKEAFLMTIF